MKSLIQLYLKEREPETFEAVIVPLEVHVKKINQLIVDDGIYLIEVLHSNSFTILEFSECRNYELIFFNSDETFAFGPCTVKGADENRLIQFPAKWVLAIPSEMSLATELKEKFDKFKIIFERFTII